MTFNNLCSFESLRTSSLILSKNKSSFAFCIKKRIPNRLMIDSSALHRPVNTPKPDNHTVALNTVNQLISVLCS